MQSPNLVFFVMIVCAALVVAGYFVYKSRAKQKLLSKVNTMYQNGGILDDDRLLIISMIHSGGNNTLIQSRIIESQARKSRHINYCQRWGQDVADNLINGMVWVGMTIEQLRESAGSPTSTEISMTSGSTKCTWIYGSKQNGSYFVIENGIVIKSVVR